MSRLITRDYRSWADYRKALDALDRTDGKPNRAWCGTESIGEALDIADRGWPEGMSYVQSVSLPAVNAITSTMATVGDWGWDVAGAAYDVGEYLSGVPECWASQTMVTSRPCVTISADIASSGGISTSILEMRGAAIVALALTLQSAGYAVRVYVVEGSRVLDRDIWTRVCLTDDGGGPLDTDRLLFALAHPSSARQLAYSFACHLVGRQRRDGCSVHWPKRNTPPDEWSTDLYLPAPHMRDAQWSSPEAVAAWVRETFENLTVGR